MIEPLWNAWEELLFLKSHDWAYGVVVSMIFTAAIGVRIPGVTVKFHIFYDYTLGKCQKTISHGFTQAMCGILGSQLGT